jgi:2-hydroxychromene-2-carboxylate isomerase
VTPLEPIEYFYSAHSAFAYLGSARFMEIASAAGRRIAHKPVDLDRVVAAAGSTGFRERSDAYRSYFFNREIMRWSEERGARIQGRPRHHQNDTTLSNCMLIAGVLDGQDMDRLAHALLEAHWRYDADLADAGTLERVGNEHGYDASALLDAAGNAAVTKAYDANTREAIERSVFGSPTYVVDGDLFYGQDRLEMVERALERPYSREWSGA